MAEDVAGPQRWPSHLILLIRVLVSAGLIAAVASRVDAGALVGRLRPDIWLPVAAVIAMLLLAAVAESLRWYRLSRIFGCRLPPGEAVRAGLIGTFFNQFFIMLSGDAYRATTLRRFGVGGAIAVLCVLTDRLFGVAGILFWIGLSLFGLGGRNMIWSSDWLPIALIAAAALLVILGLLLPCPGFIVRAVSALPVACRPCIKCLRPCDAILATLLWRSSCRWLSMEVPSSTPKFLRMV